MPNSIDIESTEATPTVSVATPSPPMKVKHQIKEDLYDVSC